MRLLEYRLDLFGQGYTVISGNMHYEELNGAKCLPIKMYRGGLPLCGESCDILNDLVENIYFDCDYSNGTVAVEECRKKYADILLGKNHEWIVIAFCVTIGEVQLSLYNTASQEIDFFSLKTDQYGFDLRFEVPSDDGQTCSLYDVSIGGTDGSKDPRTVAVENIHHVRREIEFFRKALSSDELYIEVTEYAGL